MRVLTSGKKVSVEFHDATEEIALALKGLSFKETVRLWRELEAEFDKNGLHADFMRNMCLVDRFFLAVCVFKRDDLFNEWHFERCREVEADTDGYLDLWARYHGKSSLITHAGIIQEIIKDKEIRISIFSHTKGIAKKFLMVIKQELEENKLLKEIFPDVFYENPAKQSKRWSVDSGLIVRRVENPKEATLEAWGVTDGQPTGAHFTLRVYDDLVTDKSVNTADQIEKTTETLSLSQNLGGLTVETNRAWYIGTRYSFGDTYQSMIEQGQVKTRIYPATDDGTVNGKPVLMDEARWEMVKRDLTASNMACQMLLNPLAGSQAMFNPGDFQPYYVRPQTLNIYIMVDPAGSQKKGSDKTAMAVIGVDSRMNKFLLDGYHHKMGLTEKWDKLRRLRGYWQQQIGVQGVFVGYEKFGMQSDIEYFKIEMQRTGDFFEIQELSWPKDSPGAKVDRMSRLEPDFRGKKLFLPGIMRVGGKEVYWNFKTEASGAVSMLVKNFSRPTKTDENGVERYDPDVKFNGPTKSMMERPDLAVRPIKRLNEEQRDYDLTSDFIMQAKNIPFSGGHDDLVDAVSRIYDMDVRAPMMVNDADLMPEQVFKMS